VLAAEAGIAASTASHHLARLVDAGLITKPLSVIARSSVTTPVSWVFGTVRKPLHLDAE